MHRRDDARVWPCEEAPRGAEGFHENAQLLLDRRFQRVSEISDPNCFLHQHSCNPSSKTSVGINLHFVLSASLPYFTTHTDLVRRQREAIEQRKAIKRGLQSDKEWTGDGFVKETESMVSN